MVVVLGRRLGFIFEGLNGGQVGDPKMAPPVSCRKF